MIRRLAPLFIPGLLALGSLSCGSPTAVAEPFHSGEPFTLRVGQQAASDDATTIVRFVAVAGDSRCPGGPIVCVWAGEAFVDVGVTVLPGMETVLRLRVGEIPGQPSGQETFGRYVEALELTPNWHDLERASDSRVTLRVTWSP